MVKVSLNPPKGCISIQTQRCSEASTLTQYCLNPPKGCISIQTLALVGLVAHLSILSQSPEGVHLHSNTTGEIYGSAPFLLRLNPPKGCISIQTWCGNHPRIPGFVHVSIPRRGASPFKRHVSGSRSVIIVWSQSPEGVHLHSNPFLSVLFVLLLLSLNPPKGCISIQTLGV